MACILTMPLTAALCRAEQSEQGAVAPGLSYEFKIVKYEVISQEYIHLYGIILSLTCTCMSNSERCITLLNYICVVPGQAELDTQGTVCSSGE